MNPTRARALLASLLLAGCVPALLPTLEPPEAPVVHTRDGWELPLRHYPAEGPPVLLVHGMGANHRNFDFRPETGLAPWLQERGWDVWVPVLRGDPGSVAPHTEAWDRYTFAQHAHHDLPAIVDAVLAKTGQDRLYWVGHSMGGMLLYTTLQRRPGRVTAGVTVCSPACMAELSPLQRRFRRWSHLAPLRRRLPARAGAKASLLLGAANPLYRWLLYRENMDRDLAKGLIEAAIIDLPGAMMREAAGWMKAGALEDPNGRPWVQPANLPLLVLAGSVDQVAPPASVACACEIFPSCEYRLLGREAGLTTDYGHIDTLVGTTARDEVYPVIGAFLDAQRAAASRDSMADRTAGGSGHLEPAP